MSYEYGASVGAGMRSMAWEALERTLRGQSEVRIVNAAPGNVSFKLVDPVQGTTKEHSWGEDASALLVDDGLYLAFHSASGQERDRVIRAIEESLVAEGIQARFEEL